MTTETIDGCAKVPEWGKNILPILLEQCEDEANDILQSIVKSNEAALDKLEFKEDKVFDLPLAIMQRIIHYIEVKEKVIKEY